MRLNRRTLLAAVAVLALAGSPRAVRAAEDPAVAPITKLYAKFEEALRNGAGDVKSRLDVVGPTLAETFDTASMVRVAVGPKWKTFRPEQQGALFPGVAIDLVQLFPLPIRYTYPLRIRVLVRDPEKIFSFFTNSCRFLSRIRENCIILLHW